ncbi:hypothetical protein SDC9_112194 [bioreactor metagenome]|uniref:Uncharacterized protein n=1 Tax=bioreactor metagenome TaxID=1076179 RepID=A0A645BIK7_9ZZZZ
MGTRSIVAVSRSVRILQGHRISIGICGIGGDVDEKLSILGGTGWNGLYHRSIRRRIGYRNTLRMGDYTSRAVSNRSGQGKTAGVADGDSAAVIVQGTLIGYGVAVLLQRPDYGIAADVLNILCGNIKLRTVVNGLRHGEGVLHHRQDADIFVVGITAFQIVGHGCGENILAVALKGNFAALGGEAAVKRLGERNALAVLADGPLHRQNIIIAMSSEVNGGISVGKGRKFKADSQYGKHLAPVLAFIQKDTAGIIGDSRYQLIDARSFETDGTAVIRELSVHVSRPILEPEGVIHQPFDGEAVQMVGFGFDHDIGVGMGVFWQAVGKVGHGINLEALLIAVAPAAIIGELRFQDIAALGAELQLTAVVAQRTLRRIGEGYLLAVMQQGPFGGMATDLSEHRFHHNRFVGMEDFGQVESRRAHRVDRDACATGKHSAGSIGNGSGQRIDTFFLESDAAMVGISFNPCVDVSGFSVAGQGVG